MPSFTLPKGLTRVEPIVIHLDERRRLVLVLVVSGASVRNPVWALLSQVLPCCRKQDSTVIHLGGVADWLSTRSIQAGFPKDQKKELLHPGTNHRM
jgi:hypothetical protein